MENQLTRGQKQRLMYVENKDTGEARIGFVRFSRSGRSVFYAGRELLRGNVIGGNHIDVETRETFWISGVKKRGSNAHYADRATIEIDEDAREAYDAWRTS